MRIRTLLILALCLVASLGARPGLADPLTPEQKDAIEQLIRNTIAEHPEIVLDALQAAQQKSDAQAAESARQALTAQRGALLSDPSSPVGGNPQGDVTIVEFFDYRCPYCKEVEPSLDKLLKEDGKLRIVYKEFPILGPASVYATRIALAARGVGKYDAFHSAMMAVKGTIDEDVVRRTAKAAGLDVKALQPAIEGAAVDAIIQRNYALAKSLQIEGTPSFIVGDYLLPGVADIDTLRKVVAETRKGG